MSADISDETYRAVQPFIDEGSRIDLERIAAFIVAAPRSSPSIQPEQIVHESVNAPLKPSITPR